MIDIVIGTRPEFIKILSVIRELEKEDVDYRLIHTGQHYSEELDEVFFQELELPKPDHNLDVKSGSENLQIARGLTELENLWENKEPDSVLVYGDTNSTLIGALAARKKGYRLLHVEAGLRSGNIEMSEEMNRVMTDHISHKLYSPTQGTRSNLVQESISRKNIELVGNTVVDAVEFISAKLEEEKISDILNNLDLAEGEYTVLTCHRAENVDDEDTFREIMNALIENIEDTIVYPMHPRVEDKVSDEFIGKLEKEMNVIEPLGYVDFIELLRKSKACFTDSGGIQEEVCSLKIPCFTLRDETEREESIEAGFNILAGTDKDQISSTIKKNYIPRKLDKMSNAENPYGDGKAGQRIVKDIVSDK